MGVPPVRVAVLDDYQGVALSSADFSPLAGKADIVTFPDHSADPDELAERLADFAVVVAMRERTAFPADLLDRLPKLRLLVTTGMANRSIDITAAQARGIPVCGTRILNAATSEFTWALILAVTRNLPREEAALRAGRWQTTIGPELAGRTLGILGLGTIGQAVTRYARAFDMRILAWSQNLTQDTAAEHGAELVTKQQLFERSDIVSVHVQLSPRTRGLVGAAELAALGPHGYLVNTSRGPIVEEAALVDALQSRTIAGAALDVFDVEPLPADHPLRHTPNTVLTPHLGYVAHRAYACFFTDVVEDILAWLHGSPVRELGG
jgi:phosphoglycerate dehydrogenase-like enzyme